MIYCVVPQELADELYEKLTAYYADDPNVEVIVDRRKAERRSGGGTTESGDARQRRDRRRPRVPGEFPKLEPDSS
jgi:hypothetical protein